MGVLTASTMTTSRPLPFCMGLASSEIAVGLGYSIDRSVNSGTMRLGIAGSGAIARGLARAAAEHGETVLWARREESAAAAREAIEGDCAVVTELDQLGGCELVVEAVAEDIEVKKDVLGRLGVTVPEATVLATTTSSLPVAELAAASG